MPSVVIVGTQWGDEGKGKVTDLLAAKADVVVRYQGGNNAGHTVTVGGEVFKLHLLPAGILNPRAICLLGNGVVIDPVVIFQELEDLRARGIQRGELLISPRAHVIMPYHRLLDQLEEEERGAGKRIGTTGRGIGPCYADKVARLGIRIADLLDRTTLYERLQQILPFKNAILEKVYGRPGFELEALVEEYAGYGRRLAPMVADISAYLYQAVREGRKVLFEGAQGTLLDVDHGTYPFVTSSSATAGGASVGGGIGPTLLDKVLGVAKAYTTRVGEGPFPTELRNEIGDRIRERGREYGTTTGRPRRCGWFDAVVVRYAARINGLSGLALMSLDVLSGLETVRICRAYRHRGRELPDLPADVRVLAECEPVYDELPGWGEFAPTVKSMGELPVQAQRYIEHISALVGVPVVIVSVGPERHQTLVLEDPFQ